ncbi:MAG: phospholipase/lecithinase/hemolysin [Oleiphilaceae bacterium]|jgi:outer membrane lipase/esterase
MKKLLTKVTYLAGAMTLSLSASAFDNIYFFGDSLSDTGNIEFATNGQYPARFTNGSTVATDVVAAHYGLAATASGFLIGQNLGNNYAVGGAIAIDADGDETTPDANLPTQVNAYLASTVTTEAPYPHADPAALYMIIIGGNDLFTAQGIRATYHKTSPGIERQTIRKASKARVDAAVLGVTDQILKLIATGATNILVGNAPDIGIVPSTDLLVASLLADSENKWQEHRANKMYRLSTKLTARYNRKLSRAIGEIESATGLDIFEWDMEGFVAGQIDDAEELGYTNTTDACAPVPQGLACEGFLFSDGVHPTSEVHGHAGNDILNVLGE